MRDDANAIARHSVAKSVRPQALADWHHHACATKNEPFNRSRNGAGAEHRGRRGRAAEPMPLVEVGVNRHAERPSCQPRRQPADEPRKARVGGAYHVYVVAPDDAKENEDGAQDMRRRGETAKAARSG